MSRRKWNARERLSALEAELNSPDMVQAIAEEVAADDPLVKLRREHGPGWMDPEQQDWESDERDPDAGHASHNACKGNGCEGCGWLGTVRVSPHTTFVLPPNDYL